MSLVSRPEASANDLAGGMIFRVAYNDHFAAAGRDLVALGHALGGIVGALDVEIGTDFTNDRAHIWLGKDYDRVYIRQSSENFSALFGRHERAALALEGANGIVAVDGNHELAAQFARRVQISHMAHVKKIEAAVGKGDAVATFAPGRNL